MKRNTLLIAIAAITVVGIAAGLLLSGAGPSGALQGMIAPIPTTLTLGYTVLMENGVGGYMLDLHGRLVDSTGGPVANRPVKLRWRLPDETTLHDCGTATTGADGSYSLQFEQYSWYYGRHPIYHAEFAGDSLFLASRSADVQGP
ncbi:MAG TPA: hypothetical protein PK089_05025 [Methanoregulaceae archaeon]|nr:hypothetical protein [Methanoregulaceae archaeon]HOV67797.1 hypothetical protein [Methanoregulaceae archaeon]HQJ87020.1 hypothetical protein [Methanoregulaceae archaeon]